MVKRTWMSILRGMAIVGGMTAADAAFAVEGCSTPAGVDCKQCEQIFADAGTKLTSQLAGMSCCDPSSCCAPTSVCDPDALNTCGDALADACGESCGESVSGASERTLGLFGDWGHGVTVGGWTQFGYQSGPDGAFTGNGTFNDVNFGPGAGFSNAKEWNNFNLNQQALYINKAADGSNGLGVGYRAEMIYGVDGNDTQSFGNNVGRYDYDAQWNHGIYEWALPQLYAEAALGDLSVKIGHFYTPIGYEVVPSNGNFFLSRQLTFNNSEPFTHTGALGTYKAGDSLQVLGGWVAGMDTGFDRLNGGSSFLGGFIYNVSESTSLTYMMTAGNLGWRGNGSINSIVLTHNWSDKVSSVHQFDVLGSDLNSNFGGNINTQGAGIANNSTGQINYLFYTINDKLKAGVRQEWYKADGTSYNTMTYGVNIKPMDKLVIRPEIRQMWSPGAASADGTTTAPGHDDLFNSTIFGIDAIISY